MLRHPGLRALFLEHMRRDHAPQALDALLEEDARAVFDTVMDRARQAVDAPPRPGDPMQEAMRALAERMRGTVLPQPLLDLMQLATSSVMGYGQEGEDILLARVLDMSLPGFYVDIGAHHPIRFSNTYALYRAGWRGLNVDATPGSMEAFRALRPRDINLECAVSDSALPLRFHLFEEGALNTADADLAQEYVRLGWPMLGVVDVTPRPLAAILQEHLPQGQAIDLMSVDVEGQEMGLLRSNDWERFRPRVMVVEVLSTALSQLEAHPVIALLREKGYEPVSKLSNSVILKAVE